MRKSNLSRKSVLIILTFFILFQSCKLYDQPLSVTEAIAADMPVQVINKSGEKKEYDEIYYENQELFGERYSALFGLIPEKKIRLNEEDISFILKYNKTNDRYNRAIIVGVLLIGFGAFIYGLTSF